MLKMSTDHEQSDYYGPVQAQKAENSYSSSVFPTPVMTRNVSFISHIN